MGREPSKKIFLPSSRQARPPSPVHLRRRGMPACPAYPVIRNNAAPFLFRTIPIPSVHDAGWHVRVYEASSTVKKKMPRRLRESTHELWRMPPADTMNGNSLITLIFIIPQRPAASAAFDLLPIPKAKEPAGSEKKRESSRKDSAMPGEITPSHSCRYRKSMGSREPAVCATLGQSA